MLGAAPTLTPFNHLTGRPPTLQQDLATDAGPLPHLVAISLVLAGYADISMLIGLPVSALTYWGLCRSLDLVAERAVIAVADAGLEDAPIAEHFAAVGEPG